jgi:hypothetical protein
MYLIDLKAQRHTGLMGLLVARQIAIKVVPVPSVCKEIALASEKSTRPKQALNIF